jgi:hypothetical protein
MSKKEVEHGGYKRGPKVTPLIIARGAHNKGCYLIGPLLCTYPEDAVVAVYMGSVVSV